MANLIRLVPDELKAAMQLFTQRAEQLNGLHRQMESHLDRLRSGGWTADGQEIYNSRVTAEAARAIDETFDRLGPNYTSHNSLAQGINSYMESNWSGGANISGIIRNVMNDPDMRAIVERINQGEAITPSEILPILERYPVVMPVPVPAPIAPTQPEATGTPTGTPPAVTPEVTPSAPMPPAP